MKVTEVRGEFGWLLTLSVLSQVVQSGGKNIELAVIRRNQPLKVICWRFLNRLSLAQFEVFHLKVAFFFQILESKEIEALVAEIEKEKEEEAEKKKQKKTTWFKI